MEAEEDEEEEFEEEDEDEAEAEGKIVVSAPIAPDNARQVPICPVGLLRKNGVVISLIVFGFEVNG